jgi:microsomal epoxide hydrolase
MYLRTNYQTATNSTPAQQAANLSTLSELERQSIAHCEKFQTSGNAYAYAHGTRPNTMSHVLSSSPLALLAWVGEKLLDWTDEDLAVEQILELVSLYWFTDSFARGVHPYREVRPRFLFAFSLSFFFVAGPLTAVICSD